jgi:hypothetical protein
LGFSISVFAAKPICPEDPRCKPDDGGGGGGGDPPALYTAALVSGAFRFGAVDVTLNKKGNSYSSTVPLDMVRPDDGIAVPTDQEDWGPFDQTQWDDVFAVCPELFSVNTVGSVMASDNWSIDNSGAKQAGTVGSNIRIVFRDVSVPGVFGADLDINLIGKVSQELPPIAGSVSVTLTEFSFFGAGDAPEGCKSGTLPLKFVDSILEIKLK